MKSFKFRFYNICYKIVDNIMHDFGNYYIDRKKVLFFGKQPIWGIYCTQFNH